MTSAARSYRFYDLIMVLFVSVLLISNIASSAKVVDLGVSIGPLPLSFDAGTLLFPISYIFGDVLTEVYGYRRSRRVIWAGFGSAALMAWVLWLVGRLPGEAGWQVSANDSGLPGDAAYRAILGGFASGGIIVASLVAYFAGEFSNSFVLARMKVLTRGRWLWSRTIGSTLVGEAVDTGLFVLVACAFSVFPWTIALSLIVTNYVFKCAVEVLMTPVTYGLVTFLKRAEQEDYYDYGTNFNPFHLTA
jgi:uncharacterized integral membrane protein (TIGR00697 family)